MAFLTTQVKYPGEDDWEKLKQDLTYLNGMYNLVLTIHPNDIGVIKWYVDASYVTHDDCKALTGAPLMLGDEAITSVSRKQKIKTKRSAGAELIGVDEALHQILLTGYVFVSQVLPRCKTLYVKTTRVTSH